LQTLIPPTRSPRPAVDNLNPLALGAQLQEFVIERLIGIGGFGIVYLANDTLLHRQVAIKEYMPTSMASRSDGVTVSLRSATYRQDFESGKTSFINEARMLARFKHSALIEVFRFWEQNSTAYMATPFYEGCTLKEQLRDNPGVPEEHELKQMLMPVLDALEHMHKEQVYHRDISPDNIMILHDGRPILLDLGAARAQQVENAQAMTVLVKPGYAPIEQYAGDASVQQGPWTDIYGWGASAYFALTGKPPPPSASRIMSDSIIKLADSRPAGYSPAFLSAIDAALAVRPDDRPQSIAALRSLFDHETSGTATAIQIEDAQEIADTSGIAQIPPSIASAVSKPITATSQVKPAKAKSHSKFPTAMAIGGLGAIALAATFWWFSQPAAVQVPAVQLPAVQLPAVQVPAVQVPSVPTSAEQAPTATPAATPTTTAPDVAVSAAPIVEAPKLAPVELPLFTEPNTKAAANVTVSEKMATARFAIKPWGEVYVNGENKGVSPPVKSLNLPAGEYNIEIRNGDYPSHKVKIQLKSGEVLKVNHAFVDSAQK
jgi:serine/threonine protein kinase